MKYTEDSESSAKLYADCERQSHIHKPAGDTAYDGGPDLRRTVDFGQALEALKRGERMRRRGWNGKGMFIFLVKGSVFNVNRPPLLGIYPEGTPIVYQSHIDFRTADGSIVPWLASQTDLLADDWEVA